MDPVQKSNSLRLKRKPVDDCLVKNLKSHRVEKENASSKPADHSCHSQPNLANDCVNYLKSGVPSRVVFYKQGSWCDFPDKMVKSIVDAFKEGKSSVVVVIDDQPLLVDFLSMTLVNLTTRKQRSVAWLDGTNKWSLPSSFFDEEVDESKRLGTGAVKGGAQGFVGVNVMKSPSDALKQVMPKASPPVLQNSRALDILRKKIIHVERGSESFMFVQNLFLSGMGSFAVPNDILHIHRYFPMDVTAHRKLEAFERQMRLTGQKSGNAIARYVWLGSGKQDIVSVITNGFRSTDKITHETEIGAGVYLSPENRAFASVGFCDVDEKGVQYMLLCRAILGNTGVIKPGSREDFLRIYDSGVDNCSSPNYYVMWPSHAGTHISLEYLISFRLAPKVQEYLLGLKGLWLRPPQKEVKVDLSILQPVLCRTDEGPTSPWISFRVLFETIQDNISVLERELLYRHYEELKENKITRDEMVKKMIIIVGEQLLLDSLTKLKYSPSLWYNSHAKMASSPASITPESVSIGTRNTDVEPATPSHDGPAQSAYLVDSIWGGTPGTSVALKQHSPTPSMCSESSSSRCTNSKYPLAPTVAPRGPDALVRSALLSSNVCDSAGPSLEYNGYDPLVRSSSKGRDSDVSRPTLGNSSSTYAQGVACQVQAPSMVPPFCAARSMAPEICAPTSIAPHLSAPRSIAPHLRGKMVPQFCTARNTAPHLSAPRSMAPHLRGKMPKVPENNTMTEANNHSSVATLVPMIFAPPSFSPLPKENGFATSSNECLTPTSVRQSPDCSANSANSESSSACCTDSQDPLVPIVPPPGPDALVRSALLSANVCDSARSSMEYNGHDPLVLSSSEGHDSGVSRPTLGNSASPGMEGLHYVSPSMVPEAHEALAPSNTHVNSSSTDAQGIAAATPGVACQVYEPSMIPPFCAARSMAPELGAPRSEAPNLSTPRRMASHLRGKMVPQFCAARSMAPELGTPRTMAPHLTAPRSTAPHLRGKMPKVPEKNTMPEANYSCAATVVPVIAASSTIPSPKENGFVRSSKECVTPSSVQQGPDSPASSATEPRSTPNLKNVENPAAQCGANKNFPRRGVDDSSTGACAAGTLITLSADGENGP
ncbi:unnamed protein product [Alopecurus aequalis]